MLRHILSPFLLVGPLALFASSVVYASYCIIAGEGVSRMSALLVLLSTILDIGHSWTVLVPVQAEDKAEAAMEEAEDKAEASMEEAEDKAEASMEDAEDQAEAAVEEAEVAEAAEEAQEGVLVCTWLGQERKKIRRAHPVGLSCL